MNERKNTKEAAKYLGLSEVTIKNSRMTGKLGYRNAPPYHQIGKKIWYFQDDLDQYIASCRVVPNPSPEATAA